MTGSVLILSKDRLFSRMLEIEFSGMGCPATVAEQLPGELTAKVLLLDLDTVPVPKLPEGEIVLIGFTRDFTAVNSEEGRRCSRILHRPFEVKLIREEIGTLLQSEKAQPKTACGQTWQLQKDPPALLSGNRKVPLSPQEFAVANCLAQKCGEPVSRSELSECIGVSSSNKADVYICLLRKKTAELFDGKPWIRTVRGKGYAVKPSEEPQA